MDKSPQVEIFLILAKLEGHRELQDGEQAWTDKYTQKFGSAPPCDYLANADTNGDGVVDFFDIDGFLDLLGTNCP